MASQFHHIHTHKHAKQSMNCTRCSTVVGNNSVLRMAKWSSPHMQCSSACTAPRLCTVPDYEAHIMALSHGSDHQGDDRQ